MNGSDPKDWEEVREESAPENLRRKWIVEEHFPKGPKECPSCGKPAASDSLTCLFCGAYVCEDSGFLGRLLAWFRNLFR